MKRSEHDLCAAGLPAESERCQFCGATPDDECKLYDEMSPRDIRENKLAWVRGFDPPHTYQ